MSSYRDRLIDSVFEILFGIKARKTKKAVNFDLETEAVLRETGFKSTAPAYAAIRAFMESHGFRHRQYSGYVSLGPMGLREVCNVLDDLSKELPWLPDCYERCDITSLLGPSYDYLKLSSFDRSAFTDEIGLADETATQGKDMGVDESELDVDDLTPEEQGLALDAIAELYQSYCDAFNRPNDGRCPGADRGEGR